MEALHNILHTAAVLLLTLLWLAAMSYMFFPRYLYTVTDDAVRARRWILRVIPFGSYTIPLRNVQEVMRVATPWEPLPLHFSFTCGSRLMSEGVLLVLKRRFWGCSAWST